MDRQRVAELEAGVREILELIEGDGPPVVGTGPAGTTVLVSWRRDVDAAEVLGRVAVIARRLVPR